MGEEIYELILTGKGFYACDVSWRNGAARSLFCPHCNNLLQSVSQIDVVIASKILKPHMDLIGPKCGRVQILSSRFIEVITQKIVEQSCRLGIVYDRSGAVCDRLHSAVATEDSVVVRSTNDSKIRLCKQCDRLLYWPMGPKYVVLKTLPDLPFFLSNGSVFCTPSFFERVIQPQRFVRLGIERIPIVREPIDGFAAGTRELIRSVKKNGFVA